MSTAYSYVDSNPLVELLIRDSRGNWAPFLAYVDSGAYISVLTRSDAQDLGLILEKGRRTELHGVGGTVEAYTHPVQIKIASAALKTGIAFSTSNETPRLIGRQGIFDRFVVCFNDKKKQVFFE